MTKKPSDTGAVDPVSAVPEALGRLARMIGAGKRLKLQGAEALGERVRLALVLDGKPLAVHLKPPAAEGAYVRAKGLSIAFEGRGVDSRVGRFLDGLARRLSKRKLAEILRITRAGARPEPGGTGAPVREPFAGGPSGKPSSVPDKAARLGDPVGSESLHWRNFFSSHNLNTEMGDPEWAAGRTIIVELADRECFHSGPGLHPAKAAFFNHPLEGAPEPWEERARSVIAELREGDVVLGAQESMDAVVEGVRREASHADYVLVNFLCTPVVTGEDLNGLARRCGKASGLPTLRETRKMKSERTHLARIAAELRGTGRPRPKPRPNAVNLFGFPKRYRERELKPLLGRLGLEANACVLPDADFDEVARLCRAGLHVFCGVGSGMGPELLEVLGGAAVRVPAPYGLAGSRDCVRAIAAAAGRSKRFPRAWSGMKGLLGKLRSLRRRTRGLRLGIVAPPSGSLADPEFFRGVPMLKLIEEAGFGLDVLAFDPGKAAAREILGGEPAPGTRIIPFRTRAELGERLRAGKFRAVFSDVYFDWRLTSAGKAQFSRRDFEMGLAGAVRSVERLTAACGLRFYERYAAALAKGRGYGRD